MTGLNAKNSMGVKGFVDIELVNSKTGEVTQRFQYNTVTNIGKMLFLASGPALELMLTSQIDRGALYLESPFSKVNYYNNTGLMQVDDAEKGLHLYLVNSAEALTADSKFIPVTNTQGQIDGNKLIGYAGLKRTTASPKEGVVDRVHDDYMIDATAQVQRWRFDATQALGTFNKLCIGAGIHNSPYNGFALSKGINPAELYTFGGVGTLSPYYMRPGVTGITSATEILYTTLQNSYTANAVFDFATGKSTALATDDTRYGAPLGDPWSHQVFYGGKLYFIDESGFVVKYDPATKTKENLDNSSGALWAEANLLYFGYFNGYSTDFKCYDMDASSWGTNRSFNSQTFTSTYFKQTTPANAFRECAIGKMLNGNYLIVSKNSTTYGPYYVLECTDITNVEATLVGGRPKVKSVSEYSINGKNVNIWSHVKSDFNYTKVVGLSESDEQRDEYGLKFSENWYGNMMSFVELTSPVTKTEADVLFISYGYRLV